MCSSLETAHDDERSRRFDRWLKRKKELEAHMRAYHPEIFEFIQTYYTEKHFT